MTELLDEVSEYRQKVYMLEVLLEVERGRRTVEWFKDHEERSPAVDRLVANGCLEGAPPPAHFRLTDAGTRLLKNVRAKTAAEGRIDWSGVRDVDFPRLRL
jgi:hypothetical protein